MPRTTTDIEATGATAALPQRMRVVLIPADPAAAVIAVTIEHSDLAVCRALGGARPDHVYLPRVPAAVLCDQDGKSKRLPPNRRATRFVDRFVPGFARADTIVGPALVVGLGDDDYALHLPDEVERLALAQSADGARSGGPALVVDGRGGPLIHVPQPERTPAEGTTAVAGPGHQPGSAARQPGGNARRPAGTRRTSMAPGDEPAPDAVFVYGTLKPGHLRWPALAPFADPGAGVREATVRGALWDAGSGWPAMTTGDAAVPGVLVPLDPARAAEALALLDGIEGVAAGLFQRVRVTTADGTACWTYRWPGTTTGFTAIDGW